MILNKVVFALGTNLGDKLANLKAVINALIQANIVNNINISSLYETKALTPENAPSYWDHNFYNIAIKGFTSYEPLELLFKIKKIEVEIGRQEREKWAPREIDIDILVYGNKKLNNTELTIPHIGLLERDFFLLPLAEIWADWRYPIHGKYFNYTAQQLIKQHPFVKHILTVQKFDFFNQ